VRSSDSKAGRQGSNSQVFLQLVDMVAGGDRPPSLAEGIHVLLPLVRRVIQTGQGPPALIQWIRHAGAARPRCNSVEELSRDLAEELVRLLIGPADPEAETIGEF
jgi:hypothetical protein